MTQIVTLNEVQIASPDDRPEGLQTESDGYSDESFEKEEEEHEKPNSIAVD